MIKIHRIGTFTDERGALFWASANLLDFDYKYLTIGTIKQNCKRGGHYHTKIKEKLMVIKGKLIFTIDDMLDEESIILKPGDIVDIPLRNIHTVYNDWKEEAVFIEFKSEEFDKNNPDTYEHEKDVL